MTTFHRIWQFGALGKVEVNTDPAAWELLDYLPKQEAMLAILEGRTLDIIGEVSGMTPLVRIGDAPAVYALYEGETYSVSKVASSLATMTAFLDDVATLWQGREEEYGLPTTKDNLEFAQIMLDSFVEANPESDADFWEYQCFAGLNIGFPLG